MHIHFLKKKNDPVAFLSKIREQNYLNSSITEIFKSAHFDECEIFDMFGIEFLGNKNLKRLFMPKEWVGYPLRKDYVLDDSRLAWNSEVKS